MEIAPLRHDFLCGKVVTDVARMGAGVRRGAADFVGVGGRRL